MARGYSAICGREPDLPALRDPAGDVVLRVTGPSAVLGRWWLEAVAERPEDEAAALTAVVLATIRHDGLVTTDLTPAEREHRRLVSRRHHGRPAPRDRVAALLAADADEACVRARTTLAAGAPCELEDSTESVVPLRSIFGRRARNSRRAGQGSVGFETALRALGAYSGVALTTATVDGRADGGFFFKLFLTTDLTRIVACFGVARLQRDGSRHPEAPEWTPLDDIVLRHVSSPAERVARIVAEDIPDVPAKIVAGLERHLATRHWGSFGRYVSLVGDFPSPAAVGPLTAALDLAREEPRLDVAEVVAALSVLAPHAAEDLARRTGSAK